MCNCPIVALLKGSHSQITVFHFIVSSGFTAGSLSVFEGLLKPNETEEGVDPASIDISDLPMGADSSTHNAPRIFRDKVEKGDTGLTFDRVTYMFCCRADSPSALIPITGFPNDTGPFYLYR